MHRCCTTQPPQFEVGGCDARIGFAPKPVTVPQNSLTPPNLILFFFYRKIVLLGDIKSKPINPAGVTYGGLRGAYQAYWPGIKDRYYV